MDAELRSSRIIACPIADDPPLAIECSATRAIDDGGRCHQLDEASPSLPRLIGHLQRGVWVRLGLFGGLDEYPVERSPCIRPDDTIDDEPRRLLLEVYDARLCPSPEYPV